MKPIYHPNLAHPGYGWIEPIQDSECPLIDVDTAQDIITRFEANEAEIERLQGVLETRENAIWSLKQELRDITVALDDERIDNTMTAAEVARSLRNKVADLQEWNGVYRTELDALKTQEPICNLWVNPSNAHFEVDHATHPLDELIPVYRHPVPSVPDRETLEMLALMFDSYENGTDCYEEPEEQSGYLGPAFRLSDEDFHRIADHLNKHMPRTTKEES